jgi:hypothetical protein
MRDQHLLVRICKIKKKETTNTGPQYQELAKMQSKWIHTLLGEMQDVQPTLENSLRASYKVRHSYWMNRQFYS